MAKDDWQQLLGEASRLRAAGRVDEAIIAYQRLLKARPDLPDSWYNLGFLQRHARRFKDALESYANALEFGIAGPEEVHLNRAVIYSDHLFRPEDARRELGQALAINPRYVPALLNLGNLREDLGDQTGARDAYRQALAIEPGNILALARLAGVSHAAQLDEALAGTLESALARPGLSAVDQADLGFALAGLLNAARCHDRAFDAVAAANAASRASAGPAARYDGAAHERLIDRLIATFDAPVAGRSADGAPLFICGMFRSGSTLVEQVFARHSQVTAGGELQL
ncbi:MAG: tetratricopeptide repeat protein, partial [Hyphomicrobium sp.]|nr:tetratricopeptide repeat protein [Hyphomicrobium sp.]